MRPELLLSVFLVILYVSCGHVHHLDSSSDTRPLERTISLNVHATSAKKDLIDLNIIQRTCALYVALRSSAWEGPIAFGMDMDDSLVHWNMCPGGTMVACVKVPAADGDSVMTGIPWPYAERQ